MRIMPDVSEHGFTGPATGFQSTLHARDNQQTRSIAAREALYFEGDEAGFVYEILEGAVRTSKLLSDGRRQVVAFNFAGDLIGFSHDNEHHTTCEAIAPTRVRPIRKSTLATTMRDCPEIAARLLDVAAANLDAMQDHFVVLGRKCASERLASFLLALARREHGDGRREVSFRLPMTRSDIADFLGLTIETVSRNLTSLKVRGIIDLPQTNLVHVRDMNRLRNMALQERD